MVDVPFNVVHAIPPATVDVPFNTILLASPHIVVSFPAETVGAGVIVITTSSDTGLHVPFNVVVNVFLCTSTFFF